MAARWLLTHTAGPRGATDGPGRVEAVGEGGPSRCAVSADILHVWFSVNASAFHDLVGVFFRFCANVCSWFVVVSGREREELLGATRSRINAFRSMNRPAGL